MLMKLCLVWLQFQSTVCLHIKHPSVDIMNLLLGACIAGGLSHSAFQFSSALWWPNIPGRVGLNHLIVTAVVI